MLPGSPPVPPGGSQVSPRYHPGFPRWLPGSRPVIPSTTPHVTHRPVPGTSRFPPLYTTGYHRGMVPGSPGSSQVSPGGSPVAPGRHRVRLRRAAGLLGWLQVCSCWLQGGMQVRSRWLQGWMQVRSRWLQGGYRGYPVGRTGRLRWVASGGYRGVPGDEK